jgi:flavin-dependent dehydrogenase
MSARYDAVIIGGGPAGATAALLLARAGWSVVVQEKKTFPRRKVCGEYISATTLSLLEELGLADEFEALAGPPVTRVGLFAGETIIQAPLPSPGAYWGRALGRETLDTLLLDAAARAGADVVQPCRSGAQGSPKASFRRQPGEVSVAPMADVISATTTPPADAGGSPGGLAHEYEAPVTIAAHGSWDIGPLPTQPKKLPPRASDLFGFKAHFINSELPEGLMPLLAFPGGYGGMVHVDGGRVSLSYCIRRDRVSALQGPHRGEAGEAVLAHILESCAGVRHALRGANREGQWLAAGPIRPGIRVRAEGGLFRVGNAAGEAHPVVAEGISMAMQSAWLLARRLIAWRERKGDVSELHAVGDNYAAAWRRAFAGRLRASRAIAHWAMRPAAVRAALPLLHCFPSLLTVGACASGKARVVVKEPSCR